MALVRYKNCERDVPECSVEEYLARGYSLIDEKGHVLKDSLPQNVTDYRELVIRLNKQIAEKDEQIGALESKVKELAAEIAENGRSSTDSVDNDSKAGTTASESIEPKAASSKGLARKK